MKAVFIAERKSSQEQEYSSGSVEWPVEWPGLSLRIAKEAISYVQRRTQLADYL